MIKSFQKFVLFFFLCSVINLEAQYDIYNSIDYSKVKYSLDDLGKMWTFDEIPFDKWESEYGFKPTEEWLDDVRMSALQFGRGCSSAFVSADGLIMTNHHCGRGDFPEIQKDGEDLLRDGFYAKTLEEERYVPGLFVDQLILIENVTDEIHAAMNEGKNENEIVAKRDSTIREIKDRYEAKTNLTCKVISFYNGGKYKVYGYKRYNDIRLVMAPDFQIAATGWDWDNFTYPRYELDFAFYRAYDEDGNPVRTDHYFSWSEKGAEENELIFTVGRPGSTKRLISVAQMEYLRDYDYKYRLSLYNELYQVYYELLQTRPEEKSELLHKVLSWGNSRKSYAGRLLGLKDPYIMAKKKDFEKNLKEAVENNDELKAKFDFVWDAINKSLDELKTIAPEATAFTLPRSTQPIYYNVASQLIEYAKHMNLPDDAKEEEYKNGDAEKRLQNLYPENYDYELNEKLLRAHINYLCSVLPEDHWLIQHLFGNKRGDEAAKALLEKSHISTPEKLKEFLEDSFDDILSSDDPFIYLLTATQYPLLTLDVRKKEIYNTIEVMNELLGEIVFAVHGDKIPPDATSSLRISEGTIKEYEYNGTIAPGKTTYFGMYDRYYSFGQKDYPWGLHERWLNPPADFDLTVPMGFASTNDIVGGNSGSSIINTKAEVIGIVHDGNLESLAGDFIFIPENNRAVATDSYGLLEALKYIYKTDRLVEELKSGYIEN